MRRLTDKEVTVLKQLHDEVNRSPNVMPDRTDLSLEVVKGCLERLEALKLVQRRPGGKWRITHDGKTRLTPWYQRPLGIAILAIVSGVIGGLIVAWLS